MRVFSFLFSTLMVAINLHSAPVYAAGGKAFAQETVDLNDLLSECRSHGFLSALMHGEKETIDSYISSNVDLQSFKVSPLTCALLNGKTSEAEDMIETLANKEEITVRNMHVFLAKNIHGEKVENFLQQFITEKESMYNLKLIVGDKLLVRWDRIRELVEEKPSTEKRGKEK